MKTLLRPIILSFILLLAFNFTLKAQQDSLSTSDTVIVIEEDLMNDSVFFAQLPTMKSLIDSAIDNSPLIKRQDAQIVIRELQRKEVRQDWLKYMGVYATTNYGVFDNFMNAQSGTTQGSTITTGNAFRWSVGLTITGAPFYDMINKPTQSKIKKLEAEQEIENKETIKRELRILVIQQYNDVVLNYKLLQIANENLQSNLTQLIMGEQQFKNGEIRLNELANIKEMYFKSLITFEKQKSEFMGSYMILQEIVGFEF
jgi:outer membrane protein TolC